MRLDWAFINHRLVSDEFFSVNPRSINGLPKTSILVDVESTVIHTDDLVGTLHATNRDLFSFRT